jgi:peptidoglycan/LPS O-acetylase OafA/YrhL
MSAAHAYRPDVDGLRAIAVLAVLGYHAFPGVVPGGFAGVDVFFVISGFLITGIILDDLGRGRFTFANFYMRRIRRIFPALILVLAATLLIGWRVLLPDEFTQVGKHVAAGAGFVSNIALWMEAGYFDSAAELKPLLHLWSLGVEEQYYMVWPLLLLLLKNNSKWMFRMIIAIAVGSFALNVVMVGSHPSATFYLPMTRFWELMAGSMLAYLSFHSGNSKDTFGNAKATLGIALLAAGLLLLNAQRAFPGWWALLPVLGTALLVSAGPAAWINRRILAHPALVFVGLISYPLYLWHWPLLAYARIVQGGEPPVAVRVGLLALSMLLAWLTFELVEKRIRYGKVNFVARRAVPALAATMCVVAVFGISILKEQLLPRSASIPLIAEISRASADWEFGADGERVLPGDAPRAVLFIGDSHMQHYWPRIEQLMRERAAPVRTVIFKTAGGCAPLPGIERRGQQCSRFVEEAFALAAKPEVDIVVIAASWVGFAGRPDYYKVGGDESATLKMLTPQSEWVLQGFGAELTKLAAKGKRVVVVLSSPRGTAYDPKSVIGRDGMTVRISHGFSPVARKELRAVTSPVDERLRTIAAQAGAEVVDPSDWFCGPASCPTADELGRPLYKDDSHIRASVARARVDALDQYVYLNAATRRPSNALAGGLSASSFLRR